MLQDAVQVTTDVRRGDGLRGVQDFRREGEGAEEGRQNDVLSKPGVIQLICMKYSYYVK